MRVLISGYYGGKNFGDELILHAFTRVLQGHEITVATYYEEEVKQIHGLKTIFAPSFTKKWKGCSYYKRKLADIDAVIIGGGQILQDATTIDLLASNCFLAAVALLLGKKVLFVGVGAGPIKRSFAKILVKKVVGASDRVIVRDSGSKKELRRLGLTNVEVLADPVLTLSAKRKKRRKKILGLSLREYNLSDEALESIKEFVTSIHKEYKVIGLSTEHDDKVLKQVVSEIVYFSNPSDIEKFDVDILISMRFHFLVLGASVLDKCIGLSYCSKVENFCLDHNLSYLHMDQISADSLRKVLKEKKKDSKVDLKSVQQKIKVSINEALHKSKRDIGALQYLFLKDIIFCLYVYVVYAIAKKFCKKFLGKLKKVF